MVWSALGQLQSSDIQQSREPTDIALDYTVCRKCASMRCFWSMFTKRTCSRAYSGSSRK